MIFLQTIEAAGIYSTVQPTCVQHLKKETYHAQTPEASQADCPIHNTNIIDRDLTLFVTFFC